ncbi:TetR/AcrR family transcriptional regulator [Kushneria phosphatilytica]|uniref:TetR/AcrR family transcriptional regulator n=1 Tax=Kushneria phosphatilytica TaxID=657387 RepID=A0A1S1NZ70_9GAMM|nr:TetR/AcrR family transcriptional regulator [Kushneria phosphatilytica]OHV13063.1 TetR family transcriptional regulator [Kushneria phosphatilytica]QEL10936.1 TetR/AcrR family transcriptional regulator [Kushneria phosphatilytica]
MTANDTVTRLLDTAEALFAEHGFTETSLRRITSDAGVNLAAVNYHFGSKQALIESVFSRYLTPFCAYFHAELDQLEMQCVNDRPPTLEQLLDVLFRSMLETPSESGDLRTFMKLLGVAYSQSQAHLRKHLQDRYGDSMRRFLELLRQATPELPAEERFWRLHFLLGSVIFTLSDPVTLRDLAETGYHQQVRIRTLTQRLKPVAISAMRAPLPEMNTTTREERDADNALFFRA